MKRAAWAAAVAALAFAAAAQAAPRPAQMRIAVVVGNNVGETPQRALRYAEQEVERLASLLKSQGEFASVLVVRGGLRGDVEGALATARARMAQARALGQSTLFLFFYSGHGDKDALELGSSRLPFRDLRTHLEALPADVKLAFVDACQSGALTGVKGGKRAPAYEVQMADPDSVKGLAIVTSSSANELSQESDDLRGSYFSSNLMVGLRGAADLSGDGQVTLSELYHYAFRRTLANTAASPIGGQHPAFVYNLRGAGDVVLTRMRPRDGRLRFPRESGVTYVVVERDVIGELVSSPGEDQYLALPAGDYKILRRSLARVSELNVTLPAGATVEIQPTSMATLAMDTNRRKGGAVAEIEARIVDPGDSHTDDWLEAHVGAGTTGVPGAATAAATVGAAYLHDFGALAVRLRMGFGSFDTADRDFRSHVLRAKPAVDVLRSLISSDRVALRIGLGVGLPILRQTDEGGATHMSFGGSYGAVASLGVRIAGGTWITASADAGAETFKLNGAITTKPMVSALVGAAFAF